MFIIIILFVSCFSILMGNCKVGKSALLSFRCENGTVWKSDTKVTSKLSFSFSSKLSCLVLPVGEIDKQKFFSPFAAQPSPKKALFGS